MKSMLFFFNDTATTEIYTLSLHDALPICQVVAQDVAGHRDGVQAAGHALQRVAHGADLRQDVDFQADRKSTRLNSSHANISYAVFCLKKKTISSRRSSRPTVRAARSYAVS